MGNLYVVLFIDENEKTITALMTASRVTHPHY